MKNESPINNENYAVLMIAAGSSSRLGQPKQLLSYKRTTLLDYAYETAKSVSNNCKVVLGANYNTIKQQCNIEAGNIIHFKNWENGMGSSISFGLNSLLEERPTLEYVMLLLCDQPHIDTNILLNLLKSVETDDKTICACRYDNSFGVPAIFDKKHFDELLKLDGHKGAKNVILKYKGQTHFIDFPKGNIDIDTPDDLSFLN